MNPAAMAVQGIGMAKTVAEGRRNKLLLQQQGKSTAAQFFASADAIGREYRQIAGSQAAAMAQNGGAYEGSNLKLLHQSETLAFLDRLNEAYKGEMSRLELYEEGETALRSSFISAGQSMSGGISSFGGK